MKFEHWIVGLSIALVVLVVGFGSRIEMRLSNQAYIQGLEHMNFKLTDEVRILREEVSNLNTQKAAMVPR